MIHEKPLAQITHEAIAVLCREMGVANTVRFINQFSTGYGNYTEERRDLFKDLTIHEYEAEILKLRQEKKT